VIRWLPLLLLALFISALAVVFTQHESRKRFVALQELYRIRDTMSVEWGRLQLEQSTYANDARVERVARKQLDMGRPPADAVQVIRP